MGGVKATRRGQGGAGDPRVVSRRVVHTGRKFAFEVLSVRRASGKTTEHDNVRHPGAVCIVPVLDDGRIVMLRNYRVSVQAWVWEICAGTIEKGEQPARCAARELVEETGYRAGRVRPLGWFYTTPGLTDERMHAYVGTGLRFVGRDLEEDEAITVEAIPAARVLRMIDRGEITDGKTIAAVLMAVRRGLVDGAAGGAGEGGGARAPRTGTRVNGRARADGLRGRGGKR